MVHLIAYELHGVRLPDETVRLEAAIKALGTSYAFSKNAWVVESEYKNREIGELLAPFMQPRDRLLVTRIHRDWVGWNIAQVEADWLASRNFTAIHDEQPVVRRMPTVHS
jgi:hypothetical protein